LKPSASRPEAYIYGYPLVTFDMARKQQTNVTVQADAEHAPMGQMIRMRAVPRRGQPLLRGLQRRHAVHGSLARRVQRACRFQHPRHGQPLLHDAHAEWLVRGDQGGRQHHDRQQGPGLCHHRPRLERHAAQGRDAGEVPHRHGLEILGRIYSTGTPEDYKAVHALQDQFSVVPLSAWGKPYTPPPGVVDPAFDMKAAVRKQVNALDIDDYFKRLAQLMKTNPPTAQDAAVVAQMARIGLVPGKDYDPSGLGAIDREVLKAVPKLALVEMGAFTSSGKRPPTAGCFFTKGVGNFSAPTT
jgi:hypothetical protein